MSDAAAGTPTPPIAETRAHTRTHHGHDLEDPYEWMRDKTDPQTLAYLEAENAHTEAVSERLDLAPVSEAVFQEIKGRTQETDLSVPVREGDWWYYSRTVEGSQYPLVCRVSLDAAAERPVLEPGVDVPGEQVLLDLNVEAQGQEFFSLGDNEVDHAGGLLAFTADVSGDERFDLVIRDLATGETLDEAVTDIGYGVEWSADSTHLFYTRVDDAWRPFQVWRHRVGGPAEDDVLVYQEDDEKFWMGLGSSRDKRFLIIALGSRTTSEYRLIDAADPEATPRVVAPRTPGLEYDVEPAGDRLLIVHNRDHRDFSLAVADLDATSAEQWSTVIPGADGVRIETADAFADHVVISLRRDGLSALRVLPREAGGFGEGWDVPVDEELWTIGLGGNPEYATSSVLIGSQSFVTPHTVSELDLTTGESTVLKRQPVLGGYDPADYEQRREWATAADGTRIPISLVFRKGIEPDGTNPGLLYGYGSYEISIDPAFSVLRLSYLDRGVVYAVAHVRGGGELGRTWWDQGHLEHKRNSFTDFVDCAEHLVQTGWVAPDRLSAEGRSAGGLLMGAVLNLAPERFCAVHAGVPFVDALTTILDPSLPLTVSEWDEWGDPLHDRAFYEYMRSYTPYENIRAVEYPSILVTTGLNDTRVYYVEPAKWVARLRQTVTNDPATRPIVMKTEMVAGHRGKTGRYDVWREDAFEIAFMLDRMGAREPIVAPTSASTPAAG